MTIISGDRTTGFTFDHDDQLLLIRPDGALAVEGTYAIRSTNARSSVDNFGLIDCSFGVGVFMSGDDTSVVNHQGASIFSNGEGVHMDGARPYLQNDGSIYGRSAGALFSGVTAGTLYNDGTISAWEIGVYILTDTDFSTVIVNSGVIQAPIAIGIDQSTEDESVRIENSGQLIGEVRLFAGASSYVRNTGTITGLVNLGSQYDTYDGRGGESAATVYGNGGDDTLRGGDSGDSLDGGLGRDLVRGGGGDDTLVGGAGADQLRGGGGEDVFIYVLVSESRGKDADRIRGWDDSDLTHLAFIDANTHKSGYQHFGFGGQIGAADPVAANKVQYYHKNGDTYVVADNDGDGVADLTIRIDGSQTLTAEDFILS